MAPSPCFLVSADSKGVTEKVSVSADSKGLADSVMRPKPGKTRSSSVSADSTGLSGGVEETLENWNNADDATPVFCAKSAEMQERKGDALRSGAKECARRAKESSLGEDPRGWMAKVTTKYRIYGE
jgi:hypothetical protein